jgi:hypothetical protein
MKGSTMLTFTPPRATVIAVLALGSALALAGCAAPEPESPEDSSTQQPAQNQPPGGGGVSGLIAAASDGLLQVQSSDEQTAVGYTADTTISSQVDGTSSDVAVGDCVTAITPTDADAATSIIVTDPVDGECTGGFGGGPGGGFPDGELPEGVPTDLPSDFPTDGTMPSGAPTDFPGGGGQFGGFTSGPVTAISGATLTVEAMGADDSTTATEVTVGDDTVFTVTVAADAAALVVGLCVIAQGEADDSGGFEATNLVVSEPGEEGCNAGFGGGQFPGGPGGGTDTTEGG